MSVIGSNILAGASGNQGGDYTIARSLRFRNSASAYLNRTPATSSNRKTFTFSAWVKLGALTSFASLFGQYSDGGNQSLFAIRGAGEGNDNQIRFYDIASSAFTTNIYWSPLYRDYSAWYHVVFVADTTQATDTNRIKLYVNGVQVTSTVSATYPAQNTDLRININASHIIGQSGANNFYSDGYLTEVNFIDGQALTPSSFGQTSATTGVWQPKKYAGTYGTNGFYLPFTDNSTTTTLGNDFSGNGNNWTTNNISLTAGSTYDSMTDVPTLTDINTANYAVFNPIAPASQTLSNGNLQASTASTGATPSTILASSGKWYAEIALVSGTFHRVGVCNSNGIAKDLGGSADGWCYLSDARVYNNGATTSYGVTSTNGDIINVALDLDNGRVWYGKNGTWMASGNPATNSNPSQTFTANQTMAFAVASGSGTIVYTGNFGQRPFSYTPPTGFVALNTFNLPTPTIGATASTQANKYFDATLYTGDNTARSIVNSGSMPSDLVWSKARNTSSGNYFFDVVRGVGKLLNSANTNAEGTLPNSVTAFNSNGFGLGTDPDGVVNQAGNTYVAWQWRANGTGVSNTAGSITSTVSANTSAGFSVVTYTGTGTAGTVGHGLGVTPSMIIVKRRNGTGTWFVNHIALTATQNLYLETTDSVQSDNVFASRGSTTFGVTNSVGINTNTGTYVAYCFAEVAGYSKFGSYTGNGSADGTFVYTGFRPRYVMVKRTDTTSNWRIYDTSRDPINVAGNTLYANLSNAEASGTDIDFLSSGIKIRTTDGNWNASGGTYIYMAFAETPTKYSLAR
jgi:hypothetical protein